jgi:hypothetical protein
MQFWLDTQADIFGEAQIMLVEKGKRGERHEILHTSWADPESEAKH